LQARNAAVTSKEQAAAHLFDCAASADTKKAQQCTGAEWRLQQQSPEEVLRCQGTCLQHNKQQRQQQQQRKGRVVLQ
jgi:hypothetical protein